jgi:hypothetical protein
VDIDLKDAMESGILYVFRRSRKLLGKEYFGGFDQVVAEFQPRKGDITIQGNRIQGDSNQIKVVLQDVRSVEERQDRLDRLQEAFFEDLEEYPLPIVFILDTFNGASSELQRWIAGSFLVDVGDSQRLRAVVAGSQVPKPSSTWERHHHVFSLGPIQEYAVWYDYAEKEGYLLNQSHIQMAVIISDGIPEKIVHYFKLAELGLNQL